MPKYLLQASYSAEGIRGVVKDGGVKRRTVFEKAVAALGGKVETFYFAFGDTDVYTIVDLPDNVTAAALVATIGSSGAVAPKTTVLLTPEEMDAAAKKTIEYSPPGA